MSKHPQLYEAQFPDTFRCLGVELQPLSIGHLMLLHRVNSPLIDDAERTVELDDLAFAVLICAQDYKESWRIVNSGKIDRILETWAKDLTVIKSFWPWLRKMKPINMALEMKAFRDYMEAGAFQPDFINREKEGRSTGVPALQHVKAYLLYRTTLTDEQILTRPYTLCLWDYITLKSMENDIEIVDDAEITRMQKIADAALEKLKAKGII